MAFLGSCLVTSTFRQTITGLIKPRTRTRPGPKVLKRGTHFRTDSTLASDSAKTDFHLQQYLYVAIENIIRRNAFSFIDRQEKLVGFSDSTNLPKSPPTLIHERAGAPRCLSSSHCELLRFAPADNRGTRRRRGRCYRRSGTTAERIIMSVTPAEVQPGWQSFRIYLYLYMHTLKLSFTQQLND